MNRQHILDVAIAIMHSDFASMQLYDPNRHALRLLTYRGFDPSFASSCKWIFPHSGTSCARVLQTGERVIVADIDQCDCAAREAFRAAGIHSMQSTPLRAPNGNLVGMASTHWRTPQNPSDWQIHVFDLWAKQTAYAIAKEMEAETLLRDAQTEIARTKRLVKSLEQQSRQFCALLNDTGLLH